MDGGTGEHKEPVTLDMIGQPPLKTLYITSLVNDNTVGPWALHSKG